MVLALDMPQRHQRWQSSETLAWAQAVTTAIETMALEIDRLRRLTLNIDDHSLFPFVVIEEFGDYLSCRPWNGTEAVGTINFEVAKPYLLRQSSYDTKTIPYGGTDYTFTKNASLPNKRTSDDGSTTETQVIVPEYVPKSATYTGDVIYAKGVGDSMNVTNGSSKPIGFVDANLDGRAWAKE